MTVGFGFSMLLFVIGATLTSAMEVRRRAEAWAPVPVL
jgi:hypothetical protein